MEMAGVPDKYWFEASNEAQESIRGTVAFVIGEKA